MYDQTGESKAGSGDKNRAFSVYSSDIPVVIGAAFPPNPAHASNYFLATVSGVWKVV